MLPNSNEVKKIRQLKLHLLSAFNIKASIIDDKVAIHLYTSSFLIPI